jgi:hypothetical protein
MKPSLIHWSTLFLLIWQSHKIQVRVEVHCAWAELNDCFISPKAIRPLANFFVTGTWASVSKDLFLRQGSFFQTRILHSPDWWYTSGCSFLEAQKGKEDCGTHHLAIDTHFTSSFTPDFWCDWWPWFLLGMISLESTLMFPFRE